MYEVRFTLDVRTTSPCNLFTYFLDLAMGYLQVLLASSWVGASDARPTDVGYNSVETREIAIRPDS
jgi:hypothetical protein